MNSPEKKAAPGALVAATISSESFQTKIQQALPPGLSKDRFTRAAITAIQKTPSIIEGEKNSLYAALVESAQVGLLCDGKQAALVIYNTNVGSKQKPNWIKKVQFMPMVGGIILNLGRVGADVDTQVVHENDEFYQEFGDNPAIKHVPARLGQDRGPMIGAYAIITKDGVKYREVMDAAQIEAVRAKSKSPDSLMWKDFQSEGWRKTVLRRCSKRVPIVDEVVEKTMEADDRNFQLDPDEMPPIDPDSVVGSQDQTTDQAEQQTPPPSAQASTATAQRPRALQSALDEYDRSTDEDEVF